MAGGEQVRITQAKGRPMLSWVGKRPLREVRAFPAQLVERFAPEAPAGVAADTDWTGWPDRVDRGGLLFHGDNKEVLAHLLAGGFRGKVDLVYIDPRSFRRGLRAQGAAARRLRHGPDRRRDLHAGRANPIHGHLGERHVPAVHAAALLLLKELLAPNGSFLLHADTKRNYLLRAVADEVFGAEAFVNEIVWRRADAHNDPGQFGAIHDTILYYGPTERVWNEPQTTLVSAKLETDAHYVWDADKGKYFRLGDLRGPGDRGPRYTYKGVDRYWKWSREKLEEADREGRLYFTKNGIPFYRLYIENESMPVQDLWMDIPQVKSGDEKADYPTQKPEALLERIIRASSNAGDIVLDCFIGSGTTAAVAQKLGRRWIGADINKGAIQTTEKRLAAIIREQIAAGAGEQLTLADGEAAAPPKPAQLAFSVHRVNDYDLQIQHNEAVELAVQHLGVARTRADTFFQGTLGRELVYIVPFDHPATPLDLQAVEAELRARPGEDRDVVVVALGRELSTQGWLDTWNRHQPVNRLRLVDLRTDPRHGRFFEHRPAEARVSFERAGDRVSVTIDDVLSPSILERLAGQEGILQPRVDGWRAMVDTVAIDPSYDGSVFEVGMLDVPARKRDLVEGTYEVAVDAASSEPVAVRITDMLGEEILVVEPRVPTGS